MIKKLLRYMKMLKNFCRKPPYPGSFINSSSKPIFRPFFVNRNYFLCLEAERIHLRQPERLGQRNQSQTAKNQSTRVAPGLRITLKVKPRKKGHMEIYRFKGKREKKRRRSRRRRKLSKALNRFPQRTVPGHSTTKAPLI